jgi:DNA-binding response OmpR family regulator
MNILVVDDDPMMLMSISKVLLNKGYEVEPVSNSIDALKVASDKKIDLVICDIIMPGISGFTLLNMLKKFYFIKAPVIMISSFANENMLLKLRNLGVTDFVGKPLAYDKLLLKIKKYTSYLSS